MSHRNLSAFEVRLERVSSMYGVRARRSSGVRFTASGVRFTASCFSLVCYASRVDPILVACISPTPPVSSHLVLLQSDKS